MADPEGVPWGMEPLFGRLLSKILCANVLCTLYAHTRATHFSFTVAITHVYQDFDARMAYVHVYIYARGSHRDLLISKANERIKAKVYSCIAPSAARDGDMLSV